MVESEEKLKSFLMRVKVGKERASLKPLKRLRSWHLARLGGGLDAKSCLTLATPWTVACQAPMSMGFSRQEYRSGLPFPSPEDLPNPRIESRSPGLQADSSPNELLAPYFMENRGGKGGSQ